MSLARRWSGLSLRLRGADGALAVGAPTAGGGVAPAGGGAATAGTAITPIGSGLAGVATGDFSTGAFSATGGGACCATMLEPLPAGMMLSTSTIVAPASIPSLWAAVYDRSMIRPSTNGPRSLMRTTTALPVARFVTRA